MSRTDYLETQWLKHITNNAAYTAPATIYLALFSVAPGEAGGGTEVTGGSYARQAVTWDNPAGNVALSTNTITFADMPSVTVVATALFDAATGGNMLYHHTLAASEVIAAGESVVFAIGDVSITAD